MQANSGDPDQMPYSVASDLGLHCSHMSTKRTLCNWCVRFRLTSGLVTLEIDVHLDFASVNITVLGLTNPDVNLKGMHQ